ncbi:hypothetical protein [Ruminococcus sp.]|uniref:hypothetical protein n=1 Tax=Ruminococcus sp. TaxID=41978 RepID=UPI0025D057DE|nr:hypothetical protein [Ruminococcus sp.]MBQ8967753.1 hypothetical protein [Ruminococcus sp.]
MDNALERYIHENALRPDVLIFREPEEFVKLLYASGERADMLVWYEYTSIAEQGSSLGGGGYADPKNEGFMWAETPFFHMLTKGQRREELLSLIRTFTQRYRGHELAPEFYLSKHEEEQK